jgi:hypothetical protein
MTWELKVSAFSLTEHLNELTLPKDWQFVTIISKVKYINNMHIGVALPL